MANRKHTANEIKALARKRDAARVPMPTFTNPHQVLSIAQWAALCGYSVQAARKLLLAGKGPPLLKLSARRYGIRVSDHIAWLDRLAKEAA